MNLKYKCVLAATCALCLMLPLLSGCGNSSNVADTDTQQTETETEGYVPRDMTESESDSSELGEIDKNALLTQLSTILLRAEDIGRGSTSDENWNTFRALIAKAKALNANSDLEEIQNVRKKLVEWITVMEIKAVPKKIGGMERLSLNNPDITLPIRLGTRSSPMFYDIDGDGKNELVVAGFGRSYSGVAGGSISAFKRGDDSSSVEVESLGIVFSGTNFPIYSEKTDGSPVFVTTKGEMYTEISSMGYGDVRTFSKLTGYFKLYDVDGDGKSDAVYVKGSAKGENVYDKNGNPMISYSASMYWLKNTGTEEYPLFAGNPISFINEDGAEFLVSDPTQYAYISSFCLMDLDGDGDLDLVAGGWLNEFYYYENIGTAKLPKFKNQGIRIETESGVMKLDSCRYSAINYDWDGDGKDDLLMGGDTGDVMYFRFTGRFNSETGAPIFEDGKNIVAKADYLSTATLCRPTACDFDGDGDDDLIVGDGSGYMWFVENLTGGESPKWAAPVKMKDENGVALCIKAGYNGSLQGTQEREWGYLVPCACDWDGDGDVDVIANSVTGRIVWFENIGTATAPQLTQPKAVEVEWEGETLYPAEQWWKPTGKELVTQHRTTPFAIDLNGDGLCDLVMLDHEGYLAFYERYKDGDTLKLKQGARIFLDTNGNPIKLKSDTVGDTSINGGHIGRVKIAVVDWDGDGMLDIIVSGNSFVWYKTSKIMNGKYYIEKQKDELDTGNIKGHDQGFTIVDFNGDGKPDILSGSETGYFFYLENKN